jgi:hypothetical protein
LPLPVARRDELKGELKQRVAEHRRFAEVERIYSEALDSAIR